MADDLTDDQVRAYRLADIKINELSGWDFNKLELELAEFEDALNMADFGFSNYLEEEIDLDNLFEDVKPKEKEEDKPKTILS